VPGELSDNGDAYRIFGVDSSLVPVTSKKQSLRNYIQNDTMHKIGYIAYH